MVNIQFRYPQRMDAFTIGLWSRKWVNGSWCTSGFQSESSEIFWFGRNKASLSCTRRKIGRLLYSLGIFLFANGFCSPNFTSFIRRIKHIAIPIRRPISVFRKSCSFKRNVTVLWPILNGVQTKIKTAMETYNKTVVLQKRVGPDVLMSHHCS